MQRFRLAAAILLGVGAATAIQIETVVSLGDNMPTGIAVTASGRKFMSFPRWFQGKPQFQKADWHVAELVGEGEDAQLTDFPDKAWNSWTPGAATDSTFVNVQSVFADHLHRLWILDVGAAYLGNLTTAPRLHRVDLSVCAAAPCRQNPIMQTCAFDEKYAPANSYINDVRISTDGKTAYLTNSNNGGLLVVDLATCAARLVLTNHPSTHAEPGLVLHVEGQPLLLAGTNGTAVAFQSDGLAVVNGYVWYHAVTAHTLWRVKESVLNDPSNDDATIVGALEDMGGGSSPDGMVAAANSKLQGRLYLTAVEKDGIDWYDEARGALMPLVVDARLQWPDSASVPIMGGSADGGETYLYVTASQVNTLPFVANNKPRYQPYGLYRVKLPADDIRSDADNLHRPHNELRE